MDKLRPILLALTAVAALSVAYPARANLITNGGFEDSPFLTGWSHSASFGGSNTVHSGSLAAALSGPTAFIAQNVTTTTGASYVVDFWLASLISIPGDNVSVNVLWGGTTIFSHLFTSNSAYTEYMFTVTAPSAMTALEFQSSAVGFETGVLLIDDVSVNPAGVGVPDAGSTVSLLGCALLGLAALRRKLGC